MALITGEKAIQGIDADVCVGGAVEFGTLAVHCAAAYGVDDNHASAVVGDVAKIGDIVISPTHSDSPTAIFRIAGLSPAETPGKVKAKLAHIHSVLPYNQRLRLSPS